MCKCFAQYFIQNPKIRNITLKTIAISCAQWERWTSYDMIKHHTIIIKVDRFSKIALAALTYKHRLVMFN